jgi:hypothetical protein
MRKPSSAPLPKEKGPSLFLLLMMVTGYAAMAYSVFNIVVNPIMELGWVISVDDSGVGLPSDWGGALFFLGFAGGWTLFWRFWAWKPVRKWTRAHAKATLAMVLGMLVVLTLGILLLNRESNWAETQRKSERDSLIAMGELPEDPGVVAMRRRKAQVVLTNPTMDSLAFWVDDSLCRWVGPMEVESILLEPGKYRLAAVKSLDHPGAEADTLDAVDIVIPPGKAKGEDYFILFNVQARMNFALLNFRDAFENGKIRENARDDDFKFLQTSFGKRLSQVAVRSSQLTLPHHSTIAAFDDDAALLKLVVIPPEWQGQSDKTHRYAIWSLKMEESRGLMQDNLKTIFMDDSEERAYIRDRLKRDIRAFEEAEK